MEASTKISQDQLEHIATYLYLFKKAYYLQTSTKLETADQIIDLINSGDFTFDDVFDTYLDKTLDLLDREDNEFWDDHSEMFICENYFPPKEKEIENGEWIKIRNENGFEIHFAKRANRKRRFNEEFEVIQAKLIKLLKKNTKDLNSEMKVEEVLTPATKAKQLMLENKLKELSIRNSINLKLYEVKIYRTKTQVEYYLPYQYEIIKDIEEFSDAYTNNVPGVNIKALYSSQNQDAIFYLQSRGISKKVAEMLAALKQTYFKVNMREATEAYNNDFKRRVKIVHA